MSDRRHESLSCSPVLIIGSGVAGAACAIRLRSHGVAVDLVEKATFPRTKVCGCCIGEAGLNAFSQLGIRDEVLEHGMTTRRWCASLAGRRIELSIPLGVAISREVLDPLMMQAAVRSGADVSMNCTATIKASSSDYVSVQLDQNDATIMKNYRCVVVASGLRSGNCSGLLPWTELPHGPFGISMMASSVDVDPGVIYMACNQDGYVGLVKLADGRVDVAAALQSRQSSVAGGDPVTRVQRILAASQFASLSLTEFSPAMTTPPLRRSRRAGHGRVLAIGDAAGYVEPFTGEGMTWGMQGAIAAADLIASTVGDWGHVGDDWEQKLAVLLRRRKRTCRVVTTALRSPAACRIAAGTLQLFPRLATPLLRSMNKA
ncbi:NAD(P)/FAD-dependent oxidoreductase [Novipirellula caenicola]|uniref:FAD-binding domain-containing protein n=1 Tax=Novipirellula caenicola TaxID=1536901 RepID=A0ABP9VR03_9BACT